MPYITRDNNNKVNGTYARCQFEGQEFISDIHPDLQPDPVDTEIEGIELELLTTSQDMAGIGEEVINKLLTDNVIVLTDLSDEAKARLQYRGTLKARLAELKLII